MRPPRRGTRKLDRGLLAGVLVAVLLAGCGGDDDDEPTRDEPASKPAGKPGKPADAPTPDPLGPAESKETIEEATDRITDTLAGGDCAEIGELNPISRPTLATDSRCEYLKRLDEFEVAGSEAFGEGDGAAGVIDFSVGARTFTAVLVRDADGLFHIAFVDFFRGTESVGTKPAKGFGEAAEQAVDALVDGDCGAYREVVYERFGRGAAGKDAVCSYVESNPLAKTAETFPEAEPVAIGGNAGYAFYSFGKPGVSFTLVLAEQAEDPEGKAPPLPKGAARYAFVDAYVTNRREAPDE